MPLYTRIKRTLHMFKKKKNYPNFWCCIICKQPETDLALNDDRYVESAQNVKENGKKIASPLKSKGKMWLKFSISVFQKLTFYLGENQGICATEYLPPPPFFFSFRLFLHLCEISHKKKTLMCTNLSHFKEHFQICEVKKLVNFVPKKANLVEITIRK